MATRHLNEGVLGWLLTAAAVLGGMSLCGVGGYLGARIARAIDDNLADLGDY